MLESGTGEALKRISNPSLRSSILYDVNIGRWQSAGIIAGWNIVISSVGSSKNRYKVGRSLLELAKAAWIMPLEVAIWILVEEEMKASIIIFHQSNDVVRRMLVHLNGGIDTDGVLGDRPHSRLYGTFPRVLERYVRQEGVLRLEEAIRKFTSLAAWRLRLSERGLIAPGMAADLLLFDPDTVIDTATYEEPRQHSKGIEWMIVNGVATVKGGRHTGAGAGRRLKPDM